MAEKSYRIKASVGQEQVIKTSLTQDIDFLEVLSLKLNQKDTYKLHVSNYGIIVGRVLANESFGIPNAKVSVFIKLKDEDSEDNNIVNLYPYKSITSVNKDNKRYNLLSDSSNDDCYRIVGTFPNKRLVLDNDTEIEIYDKYWKYTTVTNQSGDYMIFGIPTGNQIIHVDIDLSDIGILSQKPRDFFYKGYNKEQFDSAEQFKEGTELDNLTQLLSQNTSVYVYPFFGDKNETDISITRCDVKVPYKFEPTCVFIGSIISDRKGQHIGHACGPSKKVGFNSNLTTGEGTIEMIRRTPDGLIEEFPIKANRLIDGDGVWCYQIPMNLDYIGTDEFGNIIPVQDSTKGIPTRTSVRFRISFQETTSEASAEHVAKHLVPSVHELDSQTNEPHILNGSLYDNCYEFGSATPKEYFRDLLWNKVYSVKSFIPRFEHKNKSGKNYMGIRSVNDTTKNNIFPFNSARFQLKFAYRILCTLMSLVVDIIGFYNKLISEIICWELKFRVFGATVRIGRPFSFLSEFIKCIGMKGGWFFEEESHIYYFPKCDKECGSIIEHDGLEVNKRSDILKDRIQQALSLEYDVVNLDFHNDWINGTLYFPLWFWRKRAKKKYFFGLFSSKAKNTFCSCDRNYGALALTQGCSTMYDASFSPINVSSESDNWHKLYDGRQVKYGVIKEFTNRDGLNIYYYAPGVPNDVNYKTNNGLTSFSQLFATDIILLGSLNSCDLDNLPKTFDSLPSSTVNIPFIATFESDETGDGIVTGLDWGNDGANAPIRYQNGLLFDLSCWNVKTKYKSCVNLSRLSELHVTFDMDMKIDDINDTNIIHDGLITEKELVEHETRAKFASLNHNGLTNLVKNPTTNYDTYKFHYVYPINFDGHLETLISSYSVSRTFNDISDSNYIMYRLGEGKDSKSNLRHKKHFYGGDENSFTFPLYNNSFYFYFGLNEGNTAIDKFNTQYNALCAKRNNFAFTINYKSKAGKWCYNPSNISTDFGTIDIEFNGLTETFSYALYNEFNEKLISEENVISNNLKFGYDIKEGGKSYIVTNDGYKKDGRLKEFNTSKLVENSFGEPIFLENGVYYLEVTNSFGMKVTQKISMLQNILSPIIEEIKLGTKYVQGKTKASDICGEMDYYGEIRIKSFIIDGEECYILSLDTYYLDGVDHYYSINNNIIYPIDGIVIYNNTNYNEVYNEINNTWSVKISGKTYNSYEYEQQKEVTCKVTCSDGSQIYLILEPENDETQDISNFVCYGVGNIQSARLEKQGEIEGSNIYTLIFSIWKPGDYVLTSNQICNNLLNDNISVNTISIENGEKFQAFINDVPFNLINNDYFKGKLIPYAENLKSINKIDSFPRPWLQLENPQVYGFKGTKFSDIDFWDGFIDVSSSNMIKDDETINFITSTSKLDILKTQIKAISETCNIAYIMGEGNIPQITITTKGGKEPILIRNIHPNYNELSEDNYISNSVIVENSNVLQAPLIFPYIVDEFYQNTKELDYGSEYKIKLNNLVYPLETNKLGNYFAVFTNNGGIINLLNGDFKYNNSLYVESTPNNANVLSNISTETHTKLNKYPQAIFQEGKEYLRTMFVEKRISFSGDFYLPITCNYNVYNDDDGLWKNGNLQVKIYNVVPLVYDEDYNIIGENLSYDIKQSSDELYEEKIVSFNNKNNTTKIYYEQSGNNYSLTFTNLSYFSGITNGFSYSSTITGNSFDDILIKIRSTCDNIADNINFVYKNSTISALTFNKFIKINDTSVFNEDSNIKLTSNLMWYSDVCEVSRTKGYLRTNGRLYRALINVDGNEIDIRDEFENYLYGSENYGTNKHISFCTTKKSKLSVPFGSTFTIEASNCKMIGDLEYDVEKNNDKKEHYVFKSKVESGDSVKKSLDIGQRVNVNSGVIFYEPINDGKYIYYNDQKIFFNKMNEESCEKYYVYNKPSDTENSVKLYTLLNGKEIEIYQKTVNYQSNSYTIYEYNDNNVLIKTINGHLWLKKTLLYTTYDGIKNLTDNNKVQEELNKNGIPVYCFYSGNASGDTYDFFYTFNPYLNGEFKHLKFTDADKYNEKYKNGVNHNIKYDYDYTLVSSGGYYYENSDSENEDDKYTNVNSYINFVFKYNILNDVNLHDCVDVVIPFSRQEFISLKNLYNEMTNLSCYFYKTIETRSLIRHNFVAPINYEVQFSGNTTVIFEEKQFNYTVSNFVKKNWSFFYVVAFYYLPLNYSKVNNFLDDKFLFNINDIYDGKEIFLNKKEISGNTISIKKFVFEKNEINDRFYLREVESDKTVNYHKLNYLYRKYYHDSPKNDFYYEGKEELKIKILSGGTIVEKDIINVSAHTNNILSVHIKSEYNNDNNSKNPAKNLLILYGDKKNNENENENIYKTISSKEIPYSKQNNGISVNDGYGQIKIYDSLFTQFEISSVEDFSCYIDVDTSNDDCDSITTNAPFLSCSVNKNYKLNNNEDIIEFLDETDLKIPFWTISDIDSDIVKNVTGKTKNICILQNDKPYAIYDNNVYEYHVYKPRYDVNGYLVNESNEKITYDNGNNVHWFNVYDIYDAITNSLSNFQVNKENAKNIFANIVWDKMTFDEYKNYDLEKKKNIKKSLIIPRDEIKLILLNNNRYYTGRFNVENIFKENNDNVIRRYSNTNLPYCIPNVTNKDDLKLIKKYKTKSPVIGEIYPYLNKYIFGTMTTKENKYGSPIKVFTLNNGIEFFESSSLGFEYGDYLSIFNYHPVRDNFKFKYTISGSPISNFTLKTNRFDGIMGSHSFKPILNNSEMFESDANYNDLLYVFQPNTKYDIPKGTKIISCNFTKSYGNSNKDFKYGLVETFSQSSNFHVGPMYFGKLFTYKIINNINSSYNIVEKLPIYIFDDDVNEDLQRSFETNNVKYYFNGKEFDKEDIVKNGEVLSGITCPQINYYASYDKDKQMFINLIGVNTNDSDVYSQILTHKMNTDTSAKISIDKDKYGKNNEKELYLMKYDDKKLENRNNFNDVKPVFKFSYDYSKSNYNFSLLDSYLEEEISGCTKTILSEDIQGYLDIIVKNYNIVKLDECKYNLYSYKTDTEDSEGDDNTGGSEGGGNTGGSEGGDDTGGSEVTTYNAKIEIYLYTSTTVTSYNFITLDNITLKSLEPKWQYFTQNTTTTNDIRLSKTSDNYVILIYYGNKYYLRKNSKNGDKINESETVKFSDINNDGIYVQSEYSLYAYNDEGDEPSIGNGEIITGNTTIMSEDVIEEDTEDVTEEELKSSKDMFIEDILNHNEVYLYDYRIIGYPVKVIKDGKSNTENFALKYFGFTSKLFSDDENDFRTIEKTDTTYSYYSCFGNKNKNNDINDILKISKIKDNDIDITSTSRTMDFYTLVIPYAVSEITEQKLIQITCDDGYVLKGTQYENIICINSNGEKCIYTFDTIFNQGVIGLYIYHVEIINGITYDFVSKISNIKTLGASYLLTVDCNKLINEQNVVLSISINNLIHKFPFHYINGSLNSGFYTNHFDCNFKNDDEDEDTGGDDNTGGSEGDNSGSTKNVMFSMIINIYPNKTSFPNYYDSFNNSFSIPKSFTETGISWDDIVYYSNLSVKTLQLYKDVNKYIFVKYTESTDKIFKYYLRNEKGEKILSTSSPNRLMLANNSLGIEYYILSAFNKFNAYNDEGDEPSIGDGEITTGDTTIMSEDVIEEDTD